MPLVNGRVLLNRIQEKRVIAGAFNTTNLETTISILNAIERSGLPNFIQIAPTNAQLSGYDYIYEIVKRHADKMDVPVSLHLDHGKTLDDVKMAVRAGFTSVMIDGAALSFEENIDFTRAAVDFCKSFGVPVEAELGAILGKEDDHVSEADCKTEPEKVQRFVEQTGCDMLAVSVDNVHGLEDIPRIDIALLQRIAAVTPVPLVIHGGSGIDADILRSFVNYNVVKVNIASDLRKAFITAVGKAYVHNNNEANLARVMANAKQAVEEDVYAKIIMMNKDHPALHQAE